LIRSKPESLNNCLTKFKKSWSDFDNLIELSTNWSNVVGRELAKECKPLKIENNILIIVANHPHWRHALIYNKHNLKESILKLGIKLKTIKIIQNYQDEAIRYRFSDSKLVWEKHPSRVQNQKFLTCNICNRPTPTGEIERWGKCTFCWRKTL
tara:strand:+ start:1090 stop:1548 length:459 start_codon:yes stop_codon:yes gene_type:complete